MPSVLLTETAGEDLEDLIEKHALPQDTKDRVKERLGPLQRSHRWVLRSKAAGRAHDASWAPGRGC